MKDEIVSCEINSVVPLPVLFSSIVYLLAKFRISHHFLSRTNNCSTKTNTSLEMLSNFYFKSYSAHTRPPAPSSYFMEKKEGILSILTSWSLSQCWVLRGSLIIFTVYQTWRRVGWIIRNWERKFSVILKELDND